jgi:hypothetical protein
MKQSAVEWAQERAAKIVSKFPQIESAVLQPMLRRSIAIALLEARGFDKKIKATEKGE